MTADSAARGTLPTVFAEPVWDTFLASAADADLSYSGADEARERERLKLERENKTTELRLLETAAAEAKRANPPIPVQSFYRVDSSIVSIGCAARQSTTVTSPSLAVPLPALPAGVAVGGAASAVDGYVEDNAYTSSCTRDVEPFWELDLGASMSIHRVDLYGRDKAFVRRAAAPASSALCDPLYPSVLMFADTPFPRSLKDARAHATFSMELKEHPSDPKGEDRLHKCVFAPNNRPRGRYFRLQLIGAAPLTLELSQAFVYEVSAERDKLRTAREAAAAKEKAARDKLREDNAAKNKTQETPQQKEARETQEKTAAAAKDKVERQKEKSANLKRAPQVLTAFHIVRDQQQTTVAIPIVAQYLDRVSSVCS
jgi:hypothetical protein